MAKRSSSVAPARSRPGLAVGIVLLGLVLGTLVAAWIARRVDEQHLVTGRILLQIGRELGSARPTMVGENAAVQANPRREDVNTEAELLGSPALLEATFRQLVAEGVIVPKEPSGFVAALRSATDALGLTTEKSAEARALERWSRSLTIYAVAGSNVLGIECRTHEPEIGKVLLERMIARYLDAHLKAYSTASTEPFFQGEVERLEKRLLACEVALSRHRVESGVYDGDVEKGLVLTRRGEADAGRRLLEGRVAASRARVAELERSLAAASETIVVQAERKASPVHDDLAKKLADAERALADAESQYPADSPYVVRARTLRDQSKALLEREARDRDESRVLGPNPVRQTITQELAKASADLKAFEAELAVAKEQQRSWDERLERIEATRGKFAELIVTLAEAQKDLAQALGTARLSRIGKQLDDLQIANVTVIVPPTISPIPLRTFGLPTRIAITLQGSLLGLVVGLAVAFLLHARREAARGGDATPQAPAWQEHEGLA